MVRILKRTGGSVVPFATSFTVCWWLCIVITLVLMDAANAADSSTQAGTVTADGQTSDDGLTTMEKGMEPFFDMVNNFLGIVQPNKLTEQTWINFSSIYVDEKFQTKQFSNWKDWASYLVGFVVCVAIGVLFFIVMPITGLIFCCCRCCGKCGGRLKPHDPKRAGCKRKSYCTLLLLFNTVTLAGVVCAFLSNELVYQKLRNENDMGPVGKLTDTVDHISDFANRTVMDIEVAVVHQFHTTKSEIIDSIRNTANVAVTDVLDSLNATALLSQTRELSKVVNHTQDEMLSVANQLSFLSTHGSWLADNLTKIANDVETLCASQQCGSFQKDQYMVTANFSTLDNLSNQTAEMNKSLPLGKYIKESEDRIADTKNSTTQSVDTGIDKATASVEKVQVEIDKGIAEVRDFVQTILSDYTESLKSNLQENQVDITKYGRYWWYGGLGVSCVLLLVVLFYYIGILFGLCGERPGLGAQCCNTGTGANFLMAGVGITFLLAWLLMLGCVILFVIGGPIYTEVCRYFDDHNPQEIQPFNDALVQIIDFKKMLYEGKDVDVDLVTILEGCKDDGAIYEVLKLDNRVNITQYLDLSRVRTALDDLKSQNLVIPNVQIVTTELNQTVMDYVNAGLSGYNFTPFYREVNKNLTAGDLSVLASNLRAIAAGSNVNQDQNFVSKMEGYADQLDRLNDELVRPMKQAVANLNSSLGFLETQADAQIKPATERLLNRLQEAQDRFNNAKNVLVDTQLDGVIENTLKLTEDVVKSMLNDVYTQIGRCQPLYDAFYSMSDAVCVVLLEPLNGFWFSLGWCLFFFIPCLILAVKLAGLYRREHDEKDFDDPNYILYGGNNQDTIPLTSMDGRSRHLAYPGPGMSNSGYHRDSYTGPVDKYAPPPYGAQHNGMGSGERTPPPYIRGRGNAPGPFYVAREYSYGPGTGAAPSDAY